MPVNQFIYFSQTAKGVTFIISLFLAARPGAGGAELLPGRARSADDLLGGRQETTGRMSGRGQGQGPRPRGVRGEAPDRGQGLQAEGQTPPLRAGAQPRGDEGRKHGSGRFPGSARSRNKTFAEFQISLKVAREEHQKIEQLHLNDKRLLNDGLHAKDKQYTEVLRNMKLKHGEEVWWISLRIFIVTIVRKKLMNGRLYGHSSPTRFLENEVRSWALIENSSTISAELSVPSTCGIWRHRRQSR